MAQEIDYERASAAFIELLKKLNIKPGDIQINNDNIILSQKDSTSQFAVFIDEIPDNEIPVNIYEELIPE